MTLGHTLVVPRRLFSSWFEATPEERAAIFELVDVVRRRLDASDRPPQGYNIGINIGTAAGQMVFHLHVHVIACGDQRRVTNLRLARGVDFRDADGVDPGLPRRALRNRCFHLEVLRHGVELYRARDTRGEKLDVEVHILNLDLAAPDELARFERESKALQALSHPNISTINDFGTQDGFAYQVMEFLEGETLYKRLNAGAIPQKLAVDYMLQVAKGLSAGHERGVIHGNLKPDNLFVTKDSHVKILDFGRKWLEAIREKETSTTTGSDYTQNGMLPGTPGYISPEEIRGKPSDVRSDIFAFGAILYEMLAGKRAFPGDGPVESLVATLKKDPPDLSLATQGVSPGLNRLVRHCLEKDPEQRFQSVRNLAFDLAALSDVSAASQAPWGWWPRISLWTRRRRPSRTAPLK